MGTVDGRSDTQLRSRKAFTHDAKRPLFFVKTGRGHIESGCCDSEFSPSQDPHHSSPRSFDLGDVNVELTWSNVAGTGSIAGQGFCDTRVVHQLLCM